MPYITTAEFKLLSLMPGEWIDSLEATAPGWITAQLDLVSDEIDSRLRKRYSAPFESPYPKAVRGWLARVVTYRCFLRRGVNQTDEQWLAIQQDKVDAEAQIKEAADSEHGLFDLPLRSDTTATGVTKGNTRVYSEQSPFAGFDLQQETGRNEDASRGGTYG